MESHLGTKVPSLLTASNVHCVHPRPGPPSAENPSDQAVVHPAWTFCGLNSTSRTAPDRVCRVEGLVRVALGGSHPPSDTS
jgi:hypothetical protein